MFHTIIHGRMTRQEADIVIRVSHLNESMATLAVAAAKSSAARIKDAMLTELRSSDRMGHAALPALEVISRSSLALTDGLPAPPPKGNDAAKTCLETISLDQLAVALDEVKAHFKKTSNSAGVDFITHIETSLFETAAGHVTATTSKPCEADALGAELRELYSMRLAQDFAEPDLFTSQNSTYALLTVLFDEAVECKHCSFDGIQYLTSYYAVVRKQEPEVIAEYKPMLDSASMAELLVLGQKIMQL